MADRGEIEILSGLVHNLPEYGIEYIKKDICFRYRKRYHMNYDKDKRIPEPAMSRSDKILEAKRAFMENAPGGRGSSAWNGAGRKKETGEKQIPYGMLRMLFAGALFLALLLFCHYDVSYQGLSRETIEKALADDSHWQMLVDQTAQAIRQVKGNGEYNEKTGIK